MTRLVTAARRPLRLATHAVQPLEPRRLMSTVAPAFADKIGLAGLITSDTTFEDNFDGTSLDKTKWQVRDGYRWRAYKDAPVSTFSYTDDSSAVVANGELSLVAHNDPVTGQLKGAFLQSGRQFDSTAKNSPVAPATLTPGYSGDFEQAYGYWETRAKFSALPGEWASFWVHSYRMVEIRDDASKVNRPDVFGTEMDVVEHSATRGGASSINAISAIDNYNGYSSFNRAVGGYPDVTRIGPSKTPPSEYHVYGLLWTPTSIKFYVDGNIVNQLTDPSQISKVPQMAMLSMEVGAPGSLEDGKGSNFFGSVPDGGYGPVETSQARATFDYVRVWGLAGATTPASDASGTASGAVYVDANNDGVADATEARQAGATIFADYDFDGVQEANEPATVSAADGTYTLAGLTPHAAVHLTIVPAAGYVASWPERGFLNYVVFPGESNTRRDFGVSVSTPTTSPPPVTAPPIVTPPIVTPPVVTPPVVTPVPTTGTITGTVYLDANTNGKRDAAEVAQAGVGVFVDANNDNAYEVGELIGTSIGDGTYAITGLPVGKNLPVYLVPIAGQSQTFPQMRTATIVGKYWITLAAGQTQAKTDFGVKLASPPVTPPPVVTPPVTPPVTIPPVTTPPVTTPPVASTKGAASGTVFLDANGNAKRDAGEVARAGVRVFADSNNDNAYEVGEPVATTLADGTYTLGGLLAGKNTPIYLVPTAGQTQTAPGMRTATIVGKYWVTLTAGQTATKVDFGVKLSAAATLAVLAPAAAVVRVGAIAGLDLDGKRDVFLI